jgi:averantin hydroxylase
VIATIAYRLLLHPLRQYPGPRLWAVSRLPYIRSTVKGTIVRDLEALHKKYGTVIRVAPDELSYIDPQAVAAIYQSSPEMPKDPMHLPPFHKGAAPGILAADKEHHTRYRRVLSHGFSDKGIRAQQPLIKRHIDQLLTKLDERCGPKAVDICEWYNWATFDVIGDLAFGEPFGCLEDGKTHDWIISIQGNVKAIPIVNAIRRMGLSWLLKWIVPKKLLEMRKRNGQYSEAKVDKRLAAGAARGDLWDAVIGNGEKGPLMSKAEIVSNASAIVVAGSETSATLLSGCTWLLLKHPDVYQRLVDHVRSSFDDEEDINLVSVGKLDYMLAVLDEALRLYPPVRKLRFHIHLLQRHYRLTSSCSHAKQPCRTRWRRIDRRPKDPCRHVRGTTTIRRLPQRRQLSQTYRISASALDGRTRVRARSQVGFTTFQRRSKELHWASIGVR